MTQFVKKPETVEVISFGEVIDFINENCNPPHANIPFKGLILDLADDKKSFVVTNPAAKDKEDVAPIVMFSPGDVFIFKGNGIVEVMDSELLAKNYDQVDNSPAKLITSLLQSFLSK